MYKQLTVFLLLFLPAVFVQAQKLVPVANGWAKNSINTVVFRRNSLVTHKNTQYIAFYDAQGRVVLGKRKLNSEKWQLHVSQYKGNVNDAHNSISIMVDGDGYLHMSWDHHNHPLRYVRGIQQGSLNVGKKLQMTGKKEEKVSYPEFYRLPNGDLLFVYRDGGSGDGNLMLNYYNTKKKLWTQLQDGWINGEGQRNAYWQMVTDQYGTIHLSWVWRESGDVATNHDMGYARSKDGGKTWEKSTGEKYVLPVTQATAEYAARIPQKSELINSTSMAADAQGRPYIATYWRSAGSAVPQYQLIYKDDNQWVTKQISDRKTPFTLSGGGTKEIPIARPHIMVNVKKGVTRAVMVYRDKERGSKVTAALCNDLSLGKWQAIDLTSGSVSSWEPSYDTELWKKKEVLHLFVQKAEQGDGERTKEVLPQPVQVLEWKPVWK